MVFRLFFVLFVVLRSACHSLAEDTMASDPPDSFSESSAPSLSKITQGEVNSKAFRQFMTILMNAFRNELFLIIKANDELEFSSSVIGTVPSLLHPRQEGPKETVGSCRNNIRYAISSKLVFIQEKEESLLSGARQPTSCPRSLPIISKGSPESSVTNP